MNDFTLTKEVLQISLMHSASLTIQLKAVVSSLPNFLKKYFKFIYLYLCGRLETNAERYLPSDSLPKCPQ